MIGGQPDTVITLPEDVLVERDEERDDEILVVSLPDADLLCDELFFDKEDDDKSFEDDVLLVELDDTFEVVGEAFDELFSVDVLTTFVDKVETVPRVEEDLVVLELIAAFETGLEELQTLDPAAIWPASKMKISMRNILMMRDRLRVASRSSAQYMSGTRRNLDTHVVRTSA